MQIRLAGVSANSIVDGPGFRFTIFTQGCPHHCPGCHNPATHDYYGGVMRDADDLIKEFISDPLLTGITFSGGEPMLQAHACGYIAQAAKKAGLSVWAYTGYVWENLYSGDGDIKCFLPFVDVLVDGPFQQESRTLELLFRGSKNQRLIDVQASIKAGCAVEYVLPDEWETIGKEKT